MARVKRQKKASAPRARKAAKPRAPRLHKLIGETPAERRATRKIAREQCKAEAKRLRAWVPAERKRVAAEIEHMRHEHRQHCANLAAQLEERIKHARDDMRDRIAAARSNAKLGACVEMIAPSAPRRFGPRAPKQPKAPPDIFGDMMAAALEMAARARKTLNPTLTIDQAKHAFEDGWRGDWGPPSADSMEEYRDVYELGRQGREATNQPQMRVTPAAHARIDAMEAQWRPLEPWSHPLERLGSKGESPSARAARDARERYYGTERPPPSSAPARMSLPPPPRLPSAPPAKKKSAQPPVSSDAYGLTDAQLYDPATWIGAIRTGESAHVRRGSERGETLAAGERVKLAESGHEAILDRSGYVEAIRPYPGARNGADRWLRRGELAPVHVRAFARLIPPETRPERDDSLQDFARAVQEAAPFAAGFRDDRAYVSAVYDALPPMVGGLDAFKARLVEAHRAKLLELRPADLVGAMNAGHLKRSRIVVRDGKGRSPISEMEIPTFSLIATRNRESTPDDGPAYKASVRPAPDLAQSEGDGRAAAFGFHETHSLAELRDAMRLPDARFAELLRLGSEDAIRGARAWARDMDEANTPEHDYAGLGARAPATALTTGPSEERFLKRRRKSPAAAARAEQRARTAAREETLKPDKAAEWKIFPHAEWDSARRLPRVTGQGFVARAVGADGHLGVPYGHMDSLFPSYKQEKAAHAFADKVTRGEATIPGPFFAGTKPFPDLASARANALERAWSGNVSVRKLDPETWRIDTVEVVKREEGLAYDRERKRRERGTAE